MRRSIWRYYGLKTMPRNFVGITVMPEYIQNEGIERVLDNLVHRAGATAVATSPYVMEPAAPTARKQLRLPDYYARLLKEQPVPLAAEQSRRLHAENRGDR